MRPERSRCFQFFRQVIDQMEEIYPPSQQIVQSQEFQKFGLTDCGILEVTQGSYLVLTDDLKLAAAASQPEI